MKKPEALVTELVRGGFNITNMYGEDEHGISCISLRKGYRIISIFYKYKLIKSIYETDARTHCTKVTVNPKWR